MNQIVSAADIIAQSNAARGSGASQATVIEQSRAVAEVQSAFLMAQHRPRDRSRALNEALESCRTYEVAEGAFFKFSRGGQSVAGESIHLARELARCWGNIFYTIAELDRDDDRKRSEMVAYAIDLETNTQARLTFIVPHVRDTKNGLKPLADMRDIYENNANMGARRLRECIFAVLPPYLVKSAAEQCRATLESGDSETPLPVRVAEALAAFEKIGISKDRIEAKLGPTASFTAVDVANLRIAFQSIKRNEISADEEFPRVAAEETAAALRQMSGASRRQKDQPTAGVSPAEAADSPSTTSGPVAEAEGREDGDMGEASTADDLISEIERLKTPADVDQWLSMRAATIASFAEADQFRIKGAATGQKLDLQRGK